MKGRYRVLWALTMIASAEYGQWPFSFIKTGMLISHINMSKLTLIECSPQHIPTSPAAVLASFTWWVVEILCQGSI